MQKAGSVSNEKSKASAVTMHAEVLWIKAGLLKEVPKLQSGEWV